MTDFKVLDFASQGSNPMMNDFSLAGIKLASGEWCQVGLKEALLLIKLVDLTEFQQDYSNSKEWCHQGVAFNMSANLEDPVVATGLEKLNPLNSQER